MNKIILVFIGGGTGSLLRYFIGMLTARMNVCGVMPWATLTCNVFGCFLIGLFCSMAAKFGWSESTRLMLTVGLCGGFTTFSTFSSEGLAMLQTGNHGMYAIYVVLSIGLGLLAVILGHSL